MNAHLERMINISAVTIAMLLTGIPAGAQQAILGNQIQMKTHGTPGSTKLKIKAKESASPNTLVGDPQANGASVTIIGNGGTSGMQTLALPAGDGWRRSPKDPTTAATGWKYSNSHGHTSPEIKLAFKVRGGKFEVTLTLNDHHAPGVNVVPPNPAAYMGALITFNGPGGDTYCVNFGGAAGGTFYANTATSLKVTAPTSEATCPTTTPACGDGVIQSPTETCDTGNDLACPGACGSSGLPCHCPFCGDGVINSGEACDSSALGSCTEGCSIHCTCTTCGNNIQESPVEGCDGTDDDECPGLCISAGPNRCHCPQCGDGQINQASEQCDGADVGSCSSGCTDNCLCAVCGDGQVNQASEECDGPDDDACANVCRPDCTCSVCGNGVIEGSEDCDPGGAGGTPAPADSSCPGACTPTCGCP